MGASPTLETMFCIAYIMRFKYVVLWNEHLLLNGRAIVKYMGELSNLN